MTCTIDDADLELWKSLACCNTRATMLPALLRTLKNGAMDRHYSRVLPGVYTEALLLDRGSQ